MSIPLKIYKVENGFVVCEDPQGYSSAMAQELRKWVAADPKALSELIFILSSGYVSCSAKTNGDEK